MSILIKGMTVPKSCMDCPMNYDSIDCVLVDDIALRDKMLVFMYDHERHPNCPLIELPDVYIDISKAFMQELVDKICIKGDNECPS